MGASSSSSSPSSSIESPLVALPISSRQQLCTLFGYEESGPMDLMIPRVIMNIIMDYALSPRILLTAGQVTDERTGKGIPMNTIYVIDVAEALNPNKDTITTGGWKQAAFSSSYITRLAAQLPPYWQAGGQISLVMHNHQLAAAIPSTNGAQISVLDITSPPSSSSSSSSHFTPGVTHDDSSAWSRYPVIKGSPPYGHQVLQLDGALWSYASQMSRTCIYRYDDDEGVWIKYPDSPPHDHNAIMVAVNGHTDRTTGRFVHGYLFHLGRDTPSMRFVPNAASYASRNIGGFGSGEWQTDATPVPYKGGIDDVFAVPSLSSTTAATTQAADRILFVARGQVYEYSLVRQSLNPVRSNWLLTRATDVTVRPSFVYIPDLGCIWAIGGRRHKPSNYKEYYKKNGVKGYSLNIMDPQSTWQPLPFRLPLNGTWSSSMTTWHY